MGRRDQDTALDVSTKSKVTIVIDPGHGGEDAGAVATDGTLEKDLNLEIAFLVKELCDLNGINAVLTRDTDTLLYDRYGDLECYKGKKKVYDLKNRLRFASEQENPIYVGIHMNKFEISRYSGLQIYYSKNDPLSYELANSVRECVIKNLQPANTRKAKAADSSIYVLHNADMPAILIECGFLSNPNELEALKDESYRLKLAICIYTSIVSQIS